MSKKTAIQNTFTYWAERSDLGLWAKRSDYNLSPMDIADHITNLMSDEGYTCHPEHVSQWRNGSRALPVRVHRALLREILPALVQDIRSTNRKDKRYLDALLRTLLP